MRKFLRIALYPLVLVVRAYRKYKRSSKYLARQALRYDSQRFLKYAGPFNLSSREASLARVIMQYHVIEKGLTMPHRRLDFGHDAVLGLIASIRNHIQLFGLEDGQIRHAIGCIRAYYELHAEVGIDFSKDKNFWDAVIAFSEEHRSLPPAEQHRMTSAEFYAGNESAFPIFATTRHTSRHYEGSVDIEDVKSAVRLAMTAPSACNRQYVRVHCISNHELRDKLLNLQNGNRGFGQDADKLLVVTADLMGVRWAYERNDVYTNAGIFIMNLCYALHYKRIAHCILNWSCAPADDLKARELFNVRASEVIVALITCGRTPEEFLIAASPRKPLEDIFCEVL